MHRFNFFICLASVCSLAVVFSQSDWDFNFLRIEYNTTNPELGYMNARVIRKGSGIYALNGSVTLGVDIDDTYSASLRVYRSQTGSSQYRETPYRVEKTSFYKFMTAAYVRVLQVDLRKCTNLPVHEIKFDKPLKKGTYNINMCIVSNEKMPGHMRPGFYMVSTVFSYENDSLWISGYGEVYAKSPGFK